MTNEQREISMYGSTKADIIESVKASTSYRFSGLGMVICSYMSDVQEMNEHNSNGYYTEIIRQYMNICKMLMMEFELGFNEREVEGV